MTIDSVIPGCCVVQWVRSLVLCQDLAGSWCYVRTSLYFADTLDCLVSFPTSPIHRSPCTIQSDDPCTIRYDLILRLASLLYNMIWRMACIVPEYDINLGATTTAILSTRGVAIPIDLVSSATNSIRRRIVLFKPVTVLTSDPKSEFLCQSSLSCAEPTDP